MKYFKNTELAKLYNVSEKTVRNWVQAAAEGKLDLRLHTENDKQYVANLSHNTSLIEELAKKGKKYKNSRGFKTIKPTAEFYKLYDPKQIMDIIANLDIYKEIPLQYSYFNSGAKRWDAYTQNLAKQDTPNSLRNTKAAVGPARRRRRPGCGETAGRGRRRPALGGTWRLAGCREYLLEQVRVGLARLVDGEPARRDHRGRARPGRSRAIGGSPLSDLAIGCASKWTAP